MAGDWIKMRSNLWDDPRIGRLCDLTDQSEATVIGALYWLWSTADQHTESGILTGLSLRQIDRKTAVSGFGEALCTIGWVVEEEDGLRIVRFEEHNGKSAKRRSTDAQRKAKTRKPSEPIPDDVGEMSACEADKEQTQSGSGVELEKEKRREEYNPPVSPQGEHAHPNQVDRIFNQQDTSPTDQRFAMHLEWNPNEKGLAARLMRMGINAKSQPPHLIPDAIAAFRNHFEASGKRTNQNGWEAQLANWIQRDVRRAEGQPRAANGYDPAPLPRLPDFPEDD